MSVLMVDIGGSNVKVMVARDGEMRKTRSHRKLKPRQMMDDLKPLLEDWEYDKVSIGFPGLIRHGAPVRDPLNLGGGWLDFDYAAAFGKPVRFINDAAMQALGNYKSGRMLFMGFGTSTGTAVVVDDVVVPIEIGMMKLTKTSRLMDRVTKAALKADGKGPWLEAVHEAIELLQDVFHPDETVLGGGNAKFIRPIPENCIQVGNESAYLGAERLWEDGDLFAEARASTWKIHRPVEEP